MPELSWSRLLNTTQDEVQWAYVYQTVKLTVQHGCIPENFHVALKALVKSSNSTQVLLGLTVLHVISLNSNLTVRDQLSKWADRFERILHNKQTNWGVWFSLAQVLVDWAFLFGQEELGIRSKVLVAGAKVKGPPGGAARQGVPVSPSWAAILTAEEVKLGLPAVGPRRGEDFVKLILLGGPRATSPEPPARVAAATPDNNSRLQPYNRPSSPSQIPVVLNDMARDCDSLKTMEVSARAMIKRGETGRSLRGLLDSGYVAAERCSDWRQRVQELAHVTHDDRSLSKLLSASDTINNALECWQLFIANELFTLIHKSSDGRRPPSSAAAKAPGAGPEKKAQGQGQNSEVVNKNTTAVNLDELFSDLSAVHQVTSSLSTSSYNNHPLMQAQAASMPTSASAPTVSTLVSTSSDPIPSTTLAVSGSSDSSGNAAGDQGLMTHSVTLGAAPDQSSPNLSSQSSVHWATGLMYSPPVTSSLEAENGNGVSDGSAVAQQSSKPEAKTASWSTDPFLQLSTELGLHPGNGSAANGRASLTATGKPPPVPPWLKDQLGDGGKPLNMLKDRGGQPSPSSVPASPVLRDGHSQPNGISSPSPMTAGTRQAAAVTAGVPAGVTAAQLPLPAGVANAIMSPCFSPSNGASTAAFGIEPLDVWRQRLLTAMHQTRGASVADLIRTAESVLCNLHTQASSALAAADETHKREVAAVKTQAVSRLKEYWAKTNGVEGGANSPHAPPAPLAFRPYQPNGIAPIPPPPAAAAGSAFAASKVAPTGSSLAPKQYTPVKQGLSILAVDTSVDLLM